MLIELVVLFMTQGPTDWPSSAVHPTGTSTLQEAFRGSAGVLDTLEMQSFCTLTHSMQLQNHSQQNLAARPIDCHLVLTPDGHRTYSVNPAPATSEPLSQTYSTLHANYTELWNIGLD